MQPDARHPDCSAAGERVNLDRARDLVELAYEAAADAADLDLIDFSLIGAPLAEGER